MRTHRLATLLASIAALAACGGGAPPESAAPAAEPPAASVATPSASVEDAVAANDATATELAGRFQLGTHYQRLSPTQPTSSGPDRIEVAEVFWYGCPHCRTFDPYVKQWDASKADYVSFVRIPAVWNPLVRMHALAFYAAEALGKGAEMHDAFFNEIHVNHNPLDSAERLEAFFAQFGVEPAAFKEAFDSPAVHAKVERAEELARRYEVTSVPSVVVNGKYLTDGGMAGGYEPLLDLIDELAASEYEATSK